MKNKNKKTTNKPTKKTKQQQQTLAQSSEGPALGCHHVWSSPQSLAECITMTRFCLSPLRVRYLNTGHKCLTCFFPFIQMFIQHLLRVRLWAWGGRKSRIGWRSLWLHGGHSPVRNRRGTGIVRVLNAGKEARNTRWAQGYSRGTRPSRAGSGWVKWASALW